jgi:hypothetical protein
MTSSYAPSGPNTFNNASTTRNVPNNRYVEHVEPLGVPSVARQLTATNTSQSQALTSNVSRISIRARTSDIRYVVGVGTQTASATTSHFLANGERVDIAVPIGASIGRIRDSGATVDGVLEVTELV